MSYGANISGVYRQAGVRLSGGYDLFVDKVLRTQAILSEFVRPGTDC
jgi:hypothetical protein